MASAFKQMGLSEIDAERCRWSINGIVGAANNCCTPSHTEKDVGTILLHRFATHPKLARFIKHKQFPAFIRARAKELVTSQRRRTA